MSFEQLLGELIGEVKGLRNDVTRLYYQHDGFVQANNDRHTIAEGKLYTEVTKLDARVTTLEHAKLSLFSSTRAAIAVGLLAFGLILNGAKDFIVKAGEWIGGL